MPVGDLADLGDRRDVAVHRIDALERHELRPGQRVLRHQPVQVGRVVVAEDPLLAAGMADAGDHRGVVQRVGEDDAAGDQLRQGRQRGVVGDEAGGEEERRLLAVQVGQLLLQRPMVDVGAGDVAGAAGAGAATVQRLVHRRQHRRILAHAEVVVGAPDGDVRRAVQAVMGGAGERPGVALQLGEDPVTALGLEGVDRRPEDILVVHSIAPRY